MPDIVLKTGDRRPYLDATLEDVNGAVDLTGSTAYFYFETATGHAAVGGGICTLRAATAGTVRYTWTTGDTDEEGDYQGEFVVTFGDGRQLSFPNDSYKSFRILRSVST